MSGPTNFRQERIEKLLHELRYEINRGMMDAEIDETLSFTFFVPVSKSIKDGVVFCRFETRPILAHQMPFSGREAFEPRLIPQVTGYL